MPARPMVPFVQGTRHLGSEDGSGEEDDQGYSIPDLARIAKTDESQGWSSQQLNYDDRHLVHQQPVNSAPLVSPIPLRDKHCGGQHERQEITTETFPADAGYRDAKSSRKGENETDRSTAGDKSCEYRN